MKHILFVDDGRVAQKIINQIGADSVAAVYDFSSLENSPSDILPDILPIDDLEQFTGGETTALIAIDVHKQKGRLQYGQSFFRRLAVAIAKTLQFHKIEFTFLNVAIPGNPGNPYVHIKGKFPKVYFSQGNLSMATADLIQEVFKTYYNDFAGKEFDFWFSTWDEPERNIEFVDALNLPHIFSYCTTYSMKNRVIAFPDYGSCYNEEKFWDKNNSPSKCKEAAKKTWQDKRIFWRGSLFTSPTRYFLFELGKKYPEYLQIEDGAKGNFVPMVEQSKYKYLIDTRGNSFSVRLQTLLRLGRVLFIVYRPSREWYFNRMIPMVHYVPVEEDMSDLIEKYIFMENHPELYEKIVRNMAEFVEENFNPRRIIFDMKELLLKYCIV